MRLSERPDVLVYETEPSREALEITGRGEVELWIASSAIDTDFTAKLIDVYPPNEDYPEGYDMLINDSIIRTRFPRGLRPRGDDGAGDALPRALSSSHRRRTSSPRGTGSASTSRRRTSPRLERNPNTGEPIGRHAQMIKADQTVFSDADHPSQVVLPVIPS